MPLVGFEPTISAGERPQTYALDRAATGIGRPLLGHLFSKHNVLYMCINLSFVMASLYGQEFWRKVDFAWFQASASL